MTSTTARFSFVGVDAQRGIARRMVIGLPAEGLSATWERDFSAYPPAGVIVFRRDFADLEALRRLTSRLRSLAAPRRLFVGIDEEGGFVSQLAGLLPVPPNALLFGRGAEPGDVEWASRATGERLRSLGVDWVFAPVADVHSEPRNPVIGPRAWGETADQVTARVREAVRGYRGAGVASCLKHFPGHGDTRLDSHLALPAAEADLATLEAREFAPFRANLDADAVMTAHVVFRAIDPERPGTFSPAVAGGLLRETMGFRGLCVTDALEMKGASEGRGPTEVGRLALEAGCDLLLYATWDEAVRRARLELARSLVDGALGRTAFDSARPRLDWMATRIAPPGPAEMARPVSALTPPDWEARLERIVERGLVVRGALPGGLGPWSVEEPETGYAGRPRAEAGPLLAECLAASGVHVASDGAAPSGIVAIGRRDALPAAELEALRAACRERPTVVVALASDAFLDDLPEAALRVSACDDTPLTRQVIARAIARATSQVTRA